MTDQELITFTCAKLTKEGKTPTTSTVKFKLPHPVPFHTLIQGVMYWKKLSKEEQNELIKKAVTETTESTNKEQVPRTNARIISDVEFLKLPIQDQNIYLKHLLDELLNLPK